MEIKDINKAIERAKAEYEKEGVNTAYVVIHETVLTSKNAEYMYLFATKVPGVCMPRFEKAIARTKDQKYITLFADLKKQAEYGM